MEHRRRVRVLAGVILVAPILTAQQRLPGQRPRPPAYFPDCNRNGIDDALDIRLGQSADCDGNRVPDECDIGFDLLLDASFETGLPPGWTRSGLWHVTNQCSRTTKCNGVRYAYFGVDATCTFDTGFGEAGDLTSPVFTLPALATAATLTFCSAYEGEGEFPYDRARVFVRHMTGWDTVDELSEAQLDWETRTVDLSPYLGQTIWLEFSFESGDHTLNDFLGWQVDNVRVAATGSGGVAFDCNGNLAPDGCDIAGGVSADANLNGIPDECE